MYRTVDFSMAPYDPFGADTSRYIASASAAVTDRSGSLTQACLAILIRPAWYPRPLIISILNRAGVERKN
jgi:hypothetical protein